MMFKLVLFLLPLSLFSWDFTEKDFDNLSAKQLDIINTTYAIGNTQDLGLTQASLVIVETRAGEYLGNTNNHICGSHQVNVNTVMKSLKSKGNMTVLCRVIRGHPILSSLLSLEILKYWRDNSSSYREMVLSYNRGWNKHKHDKVYWERFTKVMNVLKNKGY